MISDALTYQASVIRILTEAVTQQREAILHLEARVTQLEPPEAETPDLPHREADQA